MTAPESVILVRGVAFIWLVFAMEVRQCATEECCDRGVGGEKG